MKKTYILILLLLFGITLIGSVFTPPVRNSYITASFGEFRDTGDKPHFHLGIDFSTFNREGISVYSAASGYVYKIWMNDPIYGNAVFIKHEDLNLITAYAHLQDFGDRIKYYSELIKKEFKGEGKIEAVFPKDQIQVQRSELIALSGSSGAAEAPHLHFEVREANENGDIIRDPLEYLDYAETRTKALELLGVISDNAEYKPDSTNNVTIKFSGQYPKIELKVREVLGKNTPVMPKRISLKIGDMLIYQIDFSKILESESYNPSVVFGNSSTMTLYALKMFSTESITPIQVNNWNQFTMNSQNTFTGEVTLEDTWGNRQNYKINFVRN